MDEEVAELFSQLKEYSGTSVEEVKETEIVEEIVHETTVSSSTDQSAIELDLDISASSKSTEEDLLQIVTSEEVTETSNDSIVATVEPSSAETEDVVDLQTIFSNVPRGYFDGKGNLFE